MRVTVCRNCHFNAAHRLHNSNWDAAKNTLVFGKCNNPNYHGHNYNLTVKLTGNIDPETGFVMDLKLLDQLVKAEIEDRFDHKNLNLDIEHFKNLNPTVENIAVVIWNILREKIGAEFDIAVTLFETERNFVEYAGD